LDLQGPGRQARRDVGPGEAQGPGDSAEQGEARLVLPELPVRKGAQAFPQETVPVQRAPGRSGGASPKAQDQSAGRSGGLDPEGEGGIV
ncbi:MAG: hypothetical protein ACLGI9_10085, partial [Thermoanaerobaculia bacterium]